MTAREKLDESMPQRTKALVKYWTASASQNFMSAVGSTFTILSYPPVLITNQEEDQGVTREMNKYAASLCSANPQQSGFFAIVPSLYAYEELHADGITLLTSYEGVYLGNEIFKPIWEELDKHNAVVFVHPHRACVDCGLAHPTLLPPVLDYPHEGNKIAMDMILNQTVRKDPNCKIILSHAGGTLPYLIHRAASLVPQVFKSTATDSPVMSSEDIPRDSRLFYYELALSSSHHTLDTPLKNFLSHHILFGTDFPAVSEDVAIKLSDELNDYNMDEVKRDNVYWETAIKLFPRLAG
ncbi:amidohydrolase family protein [Trichoderma compactum]